MVFTRDQNKIDQQCVGIIKYVRNILDLIAC